ncbi:TrkH-domain-containing protein [Pholiota conissans]|uniref:TrkH-domain-containing protein n=1 Tax=Pholiota conissans TaxID=109636 RepID=A0A9P5YYJ1_9AGAR|nr:TrkH-domain-containing protein [Pholiota conissans]
MEKDKDRRRRQRPRRHHSIIPSSIRQTITATLDLVAQHTTFFRVHVAAFTLIPLIFSGIFYACNGRYHISFVDSMFLCYSAMTVTGLCTVNLSTITTFQQLILYFLMMIGDFTVASWIMVLIRKQFFKNHCEYVVSKRKKPTKKMSLKSKASFMKSISGPIGAAFKQREPTPRQEKVANDAPNPQFQLIGPTPGPTPGATLTDLQIDLPKELQSQPDEDNVHVLPESQFYSSSPKSANGMLLSPDVERSFRSPVSNNTTRSPQVGFAMSTGVSPRSGHHHPPTRLVQDGIPMPFRRTTVIVNQDDPRNEKDTRYRNFGGFPGPTELIDKLFKKAAPTTYRKMERTMTMSTYTTLQSTNVPWLNFSGLIVGRNSDFHTESLTDEQLEDIGGAEYRALRLLSYLVPAYFILSQIISILIFLPWLSVVHTYDGVFAAQFRLVSKTWFSFFQVMGAYTGGGLSLVDLGMLPFQNAYLMIVGLIFSILAGNHALSSMTALIIECYSWITSKILPEDSEAQSALSFLLDHPRRCFLYLFPSHQTWFLVVCLVGFSIIEWVSFLVLNIGLPAYDAIPVGPRVLAGLFQGLAARASGFAIVPLSNLAPALQFLYVVMMYIAVYPVALSIRSTNVYEERSMGIFEAPPDDEDEEPQGLEKIKSGRERVGRYLGWHLRRQLSIDIWWLVWAVFLVAIVERAKLLDESMKWFDLFRVLFELVSAFGGIGLSLGLPTDNFSFSGALRPLSKLIIIVIMVRGRHRGLPVAIDRAVLLPNDLVVNSNPELNDKPEMESNAMAEIPDLTPHVPA